MLPERNGSTKSNYNKQDYKTSPFQDLFHQRLIVSANLEAVCRESNVQVDELKIRVYEMRSTYAGEGIELSFKRFNNS